MRYLFRLCGELLMLVMYVIVYDVCVLLLEVVLVVVCMLVVVSMVMSDEMRKGFMMWIFCFVNWSVGL